MKNGNGVIKRVRLAPMVLVFVLIISGLGLVSSAGEEPVEITTDKYTYCIGDPVTITATGFIPHDLWDDYFAITDEQGDLVVEPFPLIILFPGGSNRTITWTWNQTIRNYGYYTELVPPSGEQVPTGKYYAWLGHDIPGSAYGPVEFEIVDCSSGFVEPVTVTTDKYSYYEGELVTITIDGNFMVSSISDLNFISYMIKDASGNYVKEQLTLTYMQLAAIGFWQGPETFVWNQTCIVFENHYGDLLTYPPEIPDLVPPSGEQVPPGKYYVYASLNGFEISAPAEIEIIQQTIEPRELKQDAIDQLESAKTGDSKIDKKIDKIIKHIEKSLKDKLWLDESHLDPKYGKKVFYYEKKAVKYLQKLIKDKKVPDFVKDVCREVIDKLVEADCLLAHIAYEEARVYSGQKKVDKELAKCEKEFEKAEEAIAKGHFDKAIDHYKKAWEHAQKAIKHANKK